MGYPFTVTDSAVTIIPSLSASIESHVVERIIEGDISLRERETNALLHGGVTVEFGRLFVRPYAALIAVENGWLRGGATVGVRFQDLHASLPRGPAGRYGSQRGPSGPAPSSPFATGWMGRRQGREAESAYGADASRISASRITTASLRLPNAIIPTMSNSGGTSFSSRCSVPARIVANRM